MDEQYTNALVNALGDFIRAYMRDQLEQSNLLERAVANAFDDQLHDAVREVLKDVEFDVEVTARL